MAALFSAAAIAQTVKITAVNPATKQITITNFGIATTNLGTYQFCSLFDYAMLNSAGVTVNSGSLNLAPGSQVTVTWTLTGMPIGGADMCLYQPNPSFNNPAHMLSFVQWGSAGNGRENVANAAGLWVAGTFITGTAPYTYTGNGTESGVQFWQNSNPPPPTTTIVINEVDSATPGIDMQEFVELYGEPNESLDGMVLVFFNGSSDVSYFTMDLSGNALDDDGFFVIGNTGVAVAGLNFSNDFLQNGQDAVALFFGTAGQFPNGTAVTTENLIDAVVYDTNDDDDPALLVLLNSDQPQVNENQGGNADDFSISRIPDGGVQRNTDTYVAQLPTPGYSNIPIPPSCAGGTVSVVGGANQAIVCSNEGSVNVQFGATGFLGEGYLFVVTDADDLLIDFLGLGNYDFSGPEGIYHVWGVAYNGNIIGNSLLAGNHVSQIATEGDCLQLSSNFVTVIKQDCSTGGNGCGNLFFSEYLEGASNNKALEIYNPTGQSVDLSQYTVNTYANGVVVATNTLALSGTLAPGDVYVIANAQADAIILAQSDITSAVTFFNGDDAVELTQNGVPIDVIGVVGLDPGTSWSVGSGTTENNTLVRNPEFFEGTTDWTLGATQWTVFPNNTMDMLGGHTAIPCTTDPIVGFVLSALTLNEDAGEVTINVGIANPSDTDVTVEVSISGGTATIGEDYTAGLPVQLTFAAGSTENQSFTITVIDDLETEGAETIDFGLMAITPEALLGQTEMIVTIAPSDVPIPLYDIEDVRGVDANGVATSLNEVCELRGVVYGVNLRPAGLEFTMIDPTSGIGVFLASGNLGYTVNESDSVHVVGTIVQFNGLIQINPTTISLMSTGNTLKTPTQVTSLGEETESDLIQLNCVSLTDATQWTNSGSGFNVAITNGEETFTLRVDADTDVFGSSAPQGAFTLVGIGSQFDSSSPYTSGYQIIPRYISDLADGISASFTGPASIGTNNETVNFLATGTGDNFDWDFGDGATGTGASVDHTYSDSFISENTTVTITLTVTNEDGTCSVTTSETFDVIYIGINESESFFHVYPNPATDIIVIESSARPDQIVLENLLGQTVLTRGNLAENRTELNVQSLDPGIYLLRVFSGTQIGTKKVLVK